jgi:hypothetical protein
LIPDIGNRVEMSVSRIQTSLFFPFIYLENEMVSDFKTIDDLIDGFVASQYIPIWTEWMGTFRTMKNGNKYLDGGITDNCDGEIAMVGKMSERTDKQLTIKPRTMVSPSLFYPNTNNLSSIGITHYTPETCRISAYMDMCIGIEDFIKAEAPTRPIGTQSSI